jgi:hypothetical protein
MVIHDFGSSQSRKQQRHLFHEGIWAPLEIKNGCENECRSYMINEQTRLHLHCVWSSAGVLRIIIDITVTFDSHSWLPISGIHSLDPCAVFVPFQYFGLL